MLKTSAEYKDLTLKEFTEAAPDARAPALGDGDGCRGGVGTIATAFIGYLLWGEPFTALMGVVVAVVLAGIAILGKGIAKEEGR